MNNEDERGASGDLWTSVTDAYPPRKTVCLINTTSNHHLGFDVVVFDDGAWWYYEDWGKYMACNVTHWMAIPGLPE